MSEEKTKAIWHEIFRFFPKNAEIHFDDGECEMKDDELVIKNCTRFSIKLIKEESSE